MYAKVSRLLAGMALLVAVVLPVWAQSKNGPILPAAGQTFNFEEGTYRFVNNDAEFRDPTETKWPNFFWGKGTGGQVVYQDGALKGQVTMTFSNATQPNGDQSRRVLGELSQNEKYPAVTINIKSMGPLGTKEVPAFDKHGNPTGKTRNESVYTPDAELKIGEKVVKINATIKAQFIAEKDQVNRLTLEVKAAIKAKDLGLKALPAEQEVVMTAWLNGGPAAAPKKKK
jgi:hypothetical protein